MTLLIAFFVIGCLALIALMLLVELNQGKTIDHDPYRETTKNRYRL